ncbi:hypothetical protein HHK36_007713 [Tetracentron sinense]|uniref:FAD-binding domain-containing protein n=1 Tax=Tetracentron sinense TaxID=13715 RepID=A0A834ZNQ6_TETSI|nr:hypothetical protein HHK36_007713 [Tetracentron sinense]
MDLREEEEKEVVVVGGGICGLATALALHRRGISSTVLERADSLRATGVAIGIFTNGWRALDQLGVGTKLRQTAIPIQAFRDISLDKGSQREIPFGKGELRCLKRSDLIQTLANDLPLDTIRFRSQLIAVKFDPVTSYPLLQLHDGSVIKAKVVIGCDGVNSIVAELLRLKPTKLCSTYGVRGFTNYRDGHGLSSEFVRVRRDHLIMGRIPIDDKTVYWFVGRPWNPQDSNVSKDLELIRQSTLESVQGFPEEMVGMIQSSELESLTLTRLRYRAPWDILLGSFRKGTVTVAGDAMHVMGPFLGQGGSAGLEDAVVLARCLAQELSMVGLMPEAERVGAALDRYVKERRMRVTWLSTQTYLTGMLLETSSLPMKLLIIVLLIVLFGNSFGHTRYDCGHL